MDQAGQQVNGQVDRPEWAEMIDLASARLGGKAIACSDDFFAGMENLVAPARAVFIPGKFTVRGKWMDGWESRRKRIPGHDWCVLALGRPGAIRGVNVDTAHFNGNQPEWCTVEAAEIVETKGASGKGTNWKKAEWVEIVPRTPLRPSSEHFIAVYAELLERRFTHVRLNIFPDGGVARLRVHGVVLTDWAKLFGVRKAPGSESRGARKAVDLAAAENGGLVIDASNMHFGSRHNMIMPGRAKNMGDGWETRRKRGLTWTDGRPAEFDWAIVKLGHRGVIDSIEVDTNHFKGNFPESCAIELCDVGAFGAGEAFDPKAVAWSWVLVRTKLRASTRHVFKGALERAAASRPCTHVRLSIYPDGGVSRLRVMGRPVL
jgi:allantoicase